MRPPRGPALHVLLLLLLGLGAQPAAAAGDAPRDPSWATPIALPGVPNLFRVSADLYRSAQPSPDGLLALKRLGVVTVIDLREFHNDRAAAKQADLLDDELSVQTWHVTDDEVVTVMRLLSDPHGAPYLIHCHHGSDRTGLMIAMYRILHQRWTTQQALIEMTSGGYGFHPLWQNIIDYITHADVDALRARIARPP